MNTSDLYKNSKECSGCGLCSYVCPVGIIEMSADQEGFYYPLISDANRCINCRRCVNSCPVKNDNAVKSNFIGYYAGYLTNNKELKESSSGGVATFIAKDFISNGGVVYGVSYSDNWRKAVYKRAVTSKETDCFRSSKYIQSEKGDIYREINNDLKNGKNVLVFGVPCDIAAIKQRFGQYASLVTIEIICHGPTSKNVLDDYCDHLEKDAGSKITYFSCRYKEDGKWKPYYNFAKFASGKEFKEIFQKSDYGIAFQIFKRPSCNHCVFKDSRLRGDLMLGDYHYATPGSSAYNESGVSVILPHNEKGAELIPFQSAQVKIFSVSEKSALMNRAIHEAIPIRLTRSLFYRQWKNHGLHSACIMKIISIETLIIRTKNKIFHILKKMTSFIMG